MTGVVRFDAPGVLDTEPPSRTAAPHPEEMRATWDLRLGNLELRATARATPAGLIAAALLVTALMLPLAWLAAGRRRA